MEDRPFFSIVIPVYNVEKYLPNCLQSVVEQPFDDYELILVNDGSTDKCGDICKSFAACRPYVTLISQENSGLLAARRAGFSRAQGEYIISVDSDDELMPNALEIIAGALHRREVDVLFYDYTRSKEMLESHNPHLTLYDDKIYSREEIINRFCKDSQLNNMWNKAVRRECIAADYPFTNLCNLSVNEDMIQTAVILANASSYAYLSQPLYFYRPNPSSVTSTIEDNYVYDTVRAYEFLKQIAEKWSKELTLESLMVDIANRYANAAIFIAVHYASTHSKEESIETFKALLSSRCFVDVPLRMRAKNLPIVKRLLFIILSSRCYTVLYALSQFVR